MTVARTGGRGGPAARRGVARRGALLLTTGLALLLAGCGRRGDLEPAPDPSVAAATSAGESVSPIVRRPKKELITPSKQPFVLDPLL